MRCYLIQAAKVKRYASTQADARDKRDDLVGCLGCKKKDVEIGEIEISTTKSELLDFINGLCIEVDNARLEKAKLD